MALAMHECFGCECYYLPETSTASIDYMREYCSKECEAVYRAQLEFSASAALDMGLIDAEGASVQPTRNRHNETANILQQFGIKLP